ncbi:hypothetical protein C8J57DRAFT_1114292 [Mycena rebaudengoi]|nr:hypothetical protein C8J57DRAFT_1114292 [Mycena rebaudengoi]
MAFSFSVAQMVVPLFVGTILNFMLFGALFVQVYLYFIAFPADRRFTKILVVFVFTMEILQTMTDVRNTGELFGTRWGDREVMDRVGWAWFSVPVVGSIIAAVGQNFFAYRIYILSSKIWIPGIIAILTIVQMGAGIWSGVQIYNAQKFSRLNMHMKTTTVWLAASAVCDLIVVAATVLSLAKERNPEFRRQTNATVSRIIRLTVETGVVCAMFALLDLALFAKFENNYHLAVCMPLSKIYSNSIMVILNSRAYIQSSKPDDANATWKLSNMVFQTETKPASRGEIDTGLDTVGISSDMGHERNQFNVKLPEQSASGVYTLESQTV